MGRYPRLLLACMVTYITLLLVSLPRTHGANLTQVTKLYDDLFTGYNRKLLPVFNQSQSVTIDMLVAAVSLNNFDEISGELDLTLIFTISWVDERLAWTPADYGGKTSIVLPPEDIWRPQFFILQSFDKLQEVGNTSLQPRLFYNGTISWLPGMVLKVACSVDVTYFPFDLQVCPITVVSWSYTTDEVVVNPTLNYVSTSFYTENSQWELLESTAAPYALAGSPPSLILELKMKRRDGFFVVYIVIPIIFLGLINNLVFLMPVSSGERTSVAVTMFLSFVVYMEMINNSVPESSSPMAYIYYYVMFLLVYSSAIIFLCILSLRIHGKDTQVPKKIKFLIRYLRFWCLKKRRKQKVKPADPKQDLVEPFDFKPSMDYGDKSGDTRYNDDSDDAGESNMCPEITWKTVGDTYDCYCILILYLLFFFLTANTYGRLAANTGFD